MQGSKSDVSWVSPTNSTFKMTDASLCRTTLAIKPQVRRTALESDSPLRSHPVHNVGDFIVSVMNVVDIAGAGPIDCRRDER